MSTRETSQHGDWDRLLALEPTEVLDLESDTEPETRSSSDGEIDIDECLFRDQIRQAIHEELEKNFPAVLKRSPWDTVNTEKQKLPRVWIKSKPADHPMLPVTCGRELWMQVDAPEIPKGHLLRRLIERFPNPPPGESIIGIRHRSNSVEADAVGKEKPRRPDEQKVSNKQKASQDVNTAFWKKRISEKNSASKGNKWLSVWTRMDAVRSTDQNVAFTYPAPMEVLHIMLKQVASFDAERYGEHLRNTPALSEKMKAFFVQKLWRSLRLKTIL
jgi:hypothetical protein